MNEHSDLVQNARKLAEEIWCAGKIGSPVDRTPAMLRTLADIVEAYDKEPRFDENLKAIKEQFDSLDRRIGVQIVNEELHAACVGCHREIEAVIAPGGYRTNSALHGASWDKLHAVDHLAQRAVKLADEAKVGAVGDCDECVKASLVRDAIRQLDTTDKAEWVDLDEFKAADADEAKGGA